MVGNDRVNVIHGIIFIMLFLLEIQFETEDR